MPKCQDNDDISINESFFSESSSSHESSDSEGSENDFRKKRKTITAKKREAFSPHPTQDKIVVTVQDTGIGIKKLDQKQLFRMFGCLKSTRQMNTQGIGLGLFICKIIVNEFKGIIFL